MAKQGAPSSFTNEIADTLCNHIADGLSLRKACLKEGMPTKETVRSWLRKGDAHVEPFQSFLAQYTRAREEQADYYADEIVEKADEAMDRDSAAAAKVKVDARKWVSSKLRPRKYGNTLDLTSGGDKLKQAPLIVSTIKARNVETEQEAS